MSTYQPRGPESQPLCIDRGILALLRGRITDEGIWGSSSSSTTVREKRKMDSAGELENLTSSENGVVCTAPYYLPPIHLERGLRPGFSLRWRWGSLPFPSRAW